ncbi:DUF1643 domain-containing protein [Hydrogenoanaerobacterium sp.]|uniref:DUF1643 domain-containing protein n=1 Tax=Hydrogenoanaerobacterium sp. TaxID=2953763 RepID=UPI0028A2B683|nr:DUF1643 domain-containing protein [Hydrogenoanaerobacterium sp.]
MSHIPIKDIRTFGDITFATQLRETEKSTNRYDVQKWIFVPNTYTEYRYILGTIGNNPLVCIGINPSTAEPDKLDPTLQSVKQIALNNGFDSFIMFNVYAQRATSPNDIDKTINTHLHLENMNAFKYILSLSTLPTVWAAWGTIIEKRAYLFDCLSDMIAIGKQHDAKWVSCGKKSIKGHPHHPLYLRKDSQVELFDIEDYLKRFCAHDVRSFF